MTRPITHPPLRRHRQNRSCARQPARCPATVGIARPVDAQADVHDDIRLPRAGLRQVARPVPVVDNGPAARVAPASSTRYRQGPRLQTVGIALRTPHQRSPMVRRVGVEAAWVRSTGLPIRLLGWGSARDQFWLTSRRETETCEDIQPEHRQRNAQVRGRVEDDRRGLRSWKMLNSADAVALPMAADPPTGHDALDPFCRRDRVRSSGAILVNGNQRDDRDPLPARPRRAGCRNNSTAWPGSARVAADGRLIEIAHPVLAVTCARVDRVLSNGRSAPPPARQTGRPAVEDG